MLFKSELVKNSSTLLSGNVIGQAAAFAAYPVLTRIYSESDFGVFATYMTVCSILTLIGTGRYEESLVIAKDGREKSALLRFSLKWLTTFALLVFLALFFFRQTIFSSVKLSDISDFWLFIPVSVFIAGTVNLLNNLAVREKKFKTIAAANVVQNVSNAVSKLSFGCLSLTKFGLIASNIVALSAAAVMYLRVGALREMFRLRALRATPLRREFAVALKYKDFPIFNLARNLLNAFSINLPFLYLLGVFGSEKLGLYSLAFFVVSTPVNLVTGSFFNTFFEKISSSVREKVSIFQFIKDYWKGLCIYILPCFILSFFVAEFVFGFVFGSQWTESGLYFKMLLPWYFLSLAVNPVFPLIIVLRKQKQTLIMDVFCLILRCAGLFAGVCLSDFKLGILLFSVAGILITFVYLFWIIYIIKKYENSI
jgi:O-antigen/teichoic acid export membrane protein